MADTPRSKADFRVDTRGVITPSAHLAASCTEVLRLPIAVVPAAGLSVAWRHSCMPETRRHSQPRQRGSLRRTRRSRSHGELSLGHWCYCSSPLVANLVIVAIIMNRNQPTTAPPVHASPVLAERPAPPSAPVLPNSFGGDRFVAGTDIARGPTGPRVKPATSTATGNVSRTPAAPASPSLPTIWLPARLL
jgi:hypothetical protein